MTDKPGRLVLRKCRLAFASVYEKKTFEEGQDGRYEATLLINPDTEEGEDAIASIEDAIESVRKEKWGDKQPKLTPDRFCLKDGDEKTYGGFAGMMFISAANKKQPTLVDRKNVERDGRDDGLFYSGCYVDAIVTIWAQDNKYGKRINASLEALRFVEDGDALAARKAKADDFGDPIETGPFDQGEAEEEMPRRRRQRERVRVS